MIEYRGYTGVFEFDPSIDAFHGRILGLQDVVTFQGRSLDELRREMVESVEDYLELCQEAGRDPDRPPVGHASPHAPEVPRRKPCCSLFSGTRPRRAIGRAPGDNPNKHTFHHMTIQGGRDLVSPDSRAEH